MTRHVWIDASAGVAGDMLLGALLDAGASLPAVQSAVDAVAGGAVRIRTREVTRAGLRALKAEVEVLADDPSHRTWRDLRDRLKEADAATAVFRCLAEAEGRVHGIPAEDVHFHEVGALDAIADVVGCCAALADLGVTSVSAGPVALGSGTVRAQHGRLPVPAPAVAELARGWQVSAGGDGELATPTGMALLRTLARACEPLPPMVLDRVGVGAGTRDPAGRSNVVRVLVGAGEAPVEEPPPAGREQSAVLLEANVDDLDPRLWPGILAALLRRGASDAWLVPIVMKKGRPAHTLSVLCSPALAGPLREQIFRDTSTLGIRHSPYGKVALDRGFADVTVDDTRVVVKIGHRDGVILQVMPEFEDVAALARRQDRPERLVLQDALAAALDAGLTVGAELGMTLRPA
ncbi:nickel pincer cofactor biosynthesis protein LarC [Actinoplanes sp. TRM 88003]|uniref:Pyridinium-3,5-bisthiocarboxylic acid mononucleotide nickel insertion protein n=1 Tax=Paractinoplanes aksuensis TaxID=2939490 RepID=A0ABT1DGN0_9ACTN|nr:nickel pincer cofactor biosynthesis protein LarC [Actinoplanes aksuensis]MCO8269226.1 nickel pincer cofactor biosynthesis protein LarC [Actinoplanes aksuensis]